MHLNLEEEQKKTTTTFHGFLTFLSIIFLKGTMAHMCVLQKKKRKEQKGCLVLLSLLVEKLRINLNPLTLYALYLLTKNVSQGYTGASKKTKVSCCSFTVSFK